METLSAHVLDQVQLRGQYERTITDTAQLAITLAAPQDTARLTTDFDDGTTPLRDVGGMFTAQRTAILNAYEAGTISAMATSHPEILSVPVANLHKRVVLGTQDQPVGHNFFVNATGFLDAGLPWAKQFDESIQLRTGISIYHIAQSTDKVAKDQLLTAITGNPDPELMTTLAIYLAGRSLEGEKYLIQHYGKVLEQSKGRVYKTAQTISETTNLRPDMLKRVARQLIRTAFGSFDHLQGLVTSDNSGAAGDYLIGSLRVEVQFDGSVRSARLRDDSDAQHVIAHELHHAASAQSTLQNGVRCGLQANGQGLEANEGMTEYLAQLSIDSPGIERLPGGGSHIRNGVPYRVPVFVMMALHEQFKSGRNNHFALLFNAYHGDAQNSSELERALDTFYRHDAAVTDQLGR